MNQKQIGIVLIIVGIILSVLVFTIKYREDTVLDKIITERGSCFLDDGTCLHADRNLGFYVVGWIISGAILLLGAYLSFVDKTQEKLAEHQVKVSSALKEVKEKDEFKAYLAGFPQDESEILKAIKDQDGILQSTLRFKTGISKTRLSLILKAMEDKEILSRKPEGKSNKIFLRKKW